MTRIALDQRPCAACGRDNYVSTAAWDFTNGPACICDRCHNDGWCFASDGTVTRCPSELDIAIQRANEEVRERLREASARRWAKPGAKEAMSRIRKAYWAQRKAQA